MKDFLNGDILLNGQRMRSRPPDFTMRPSMTREELKAMIADGLKIPDRKSIMFNITVTKPALLEKLRANRDEHRAVFEAAMEGYREYAIAQLDRRIALLREGKTIEENYRVPIPEDHTDDYDRVIGMLEMDTAATVDLDESQYACYVDNDWAWARNFAVTNSGYTQLAGTSYGKFAGPSAR